MSVYYFLLNGMVMQSSNAPGHHLAVRDEAGLSQSINLFHEPEFDACQIKRDPVDILLLYVVYHLFMSPMKQIKYWLFGIYRPAPLPAPPPPPPINCCALIELAILQYSVKRTHRFARAGSCIICWIWLMSGIPPPPSRR